MIHADDFQTVDRDVGRVSSLTYRWFEIGLSFRATNGATIVQTHDWLVPSEGHLGAVYLREVAIDSNVPGVPPRVILGPS